MQDHTYERPATLAEDQLPDDAEVLPASLGSDLAEDAKEVADYERIHDAQRGETVEAPEQVTWADPMEAFLAADHVMDALPFQTVYLVRSLGAVTHRVAIEVQACPTQRYNRIIAQHTQFKRDDSGRTMQVTREREVKEQLILESVRNINFNDPALQKRYGGSDPHALIESMFLAGEIEYLANTIATLSGYGVQSDLEEEAGN